MKKIFNSKRVCRIIIAIILIYTVITCISQSKKLNSYADQKVYYVSQINELEEEQEELTEEQEQVNSSEYIEEQAREKLDMYYPNERVYIAQQ